MRILAAVFIAALGLMAFSCTQEGTAPVSMCKSYTDVDSCKADAGCKWNDEVSVCKDKS